MSLSGGLVANEYIRYPRNCGNVLDVSVDVSVDVLNVSEALSGLFLSYPGAHPTLSYYETYDMLTVWLN